MTRASPKWCEQLRRVIKAPEPRRKVACRIYPGCWRAYIGAMESALGFHEIKALLEWQLEMGASEAIGDAPIDRYQLAKAPPAAQGKFGARPALAHPAPSRPAPSHEIDPIAAAENAALAAQDLGALQAALAKFDHCDLKKGARNMVFADGLPGARVMVICDAPGRDEDRQGTPFVGQQAALLDKMLAAIGLARAPNKPAIGLAHTPEDPANAVYIAPASPWRGGPNGELSPNDAAILAPFLQRHITLAAPKILILMGNTACQILLEQRGITRLRGQWVTALGLPALPMYPPEYLLKNPAAKREAWADLLQLQAKLRDTE